MGLQYLTSLGSTNPIVRSSAPRRKHTSWNGNVSNIKRILEFHEEDAHQRNNNGKQVLDILNKKFNSFRNENGKDSSDDGVGSVVKRTLQVHSFLDFIHLTDHPAIITPLSCTRESINQITHSELRRFIEKSFNLARFNLWRSDRVAICLPEGPVLSLCLLSTMAYCTCVPSNYKLTPEELLNDYKHLKVKAVIVPYDKLITTRGGGDPLIDHFRLAGLQLIGLKTTDDIKFVLVPDPIEINDNNELTIADTPPLNEATDVVMLIQTSGTTGHKKIVPYRLRTLCISIFCVIFSLDIKKADTIINMMPLYHIGGIIRSLLAPVFSGGSIIQCQVLDTRKAFHSTYLSTGELIHAQNPLPLAVLGLYSANKYNLQGFDPVLFCDILEKQTNPIWFYGVPSMQQSIIREASMRKLSTKCCRLVKKVCNAGAALSPSLATEIKSIFTQAVILPSYGMTECMPICAPPVDYNLELKGTSGQVIGPELAISVDNKITRDENVIGNILVRGSPCFEGYEGVDNSMTFDKEGFFDTGDMGYTDRNGYVYVTGRLKEVINRGGEILSPLEIENVLITHPKVAQVMAFSVPHETLQETVGCVIVARDPQTRPDLRSLRNFLDKKLHSSKHPQLLVYMTDIPKSNVGKVLRINFSSRLNLPCITNATEGLPSKLLYEASSTATEKLSNAIPCCPVEWSVIDVIETVEKHPQIKACAAHCNGAKFYLFIVNANDEENGTLVSSIEKHLKSTFHDYMQPTEIIVVQEHVFKDRNSIDEKYLPRLLKPKQETTNDPVTLALCDIFGLAIGISKGSDINFPANGNFFDHGGNSLKAGFLMSVIRKKLGVTLPVTTLYEDDCQTPSGLAFKCREGMPKVHTLLTDGYDTFRLEEEVCNWDLNRTFNSSTYKKQMKSRPRSGAKNPSNPLVMLFQASPFYLIEPFVKILRWTIFVHVLMYVKFTLRKNVNIQLPNLLWLLFSLLITGMSCSIVLPLVGILMKWLIIGRYRAGTYSLWGAYYLRWWFINKLLLVTNAGIFKLSPKLYALYLRLMGAKVGSNSRISCDAKIQEYDLITIGSNCYVDNCIMRPFVLRRGHMHLSNIVVGDRCVIGFRTNVVAGTNLASGIVVGPQTTTYARDMHGNGSSAHIDTVEGGKLRALCKETFAEPHFMLEYLVGWPIVILTKIAAHIPWFLCLHLLTRYRSASKYENVAELVIHFSCSKRIAYFILARFVRNYVVRLLYIILVILIKRLIIGKFEAGPRKLDQWSLMKHWLMKNLLSLEHWHSLTRIVGAHYEGVSIIYRLLGAKVGKRVYWPGSNINVVEFDLLTVGNDCTFGSRSQILCGDATECAPVTIDDGAMCGDNCVILPGCRIGRNAVLGTGGLLKKHFNLAERSVWYGSINGNAVKLRDSGVSMKMSPTNVNKEKDQTMGSYQEDDTSKPFGRAFYERKANYFVFPLSFILFYNAILLIIDTIVKSIPILSALQVTALYIRTNEAVLQSAGQIILVLFCFFSIFYVLTTVGILSLDIIAKWTLIGRFKQGTYNWDESSYSQRWKLLVEVRKMGGMNKLSFMGGSSWIVLFYRALGCNIGKRVCLYPNGGDPFMTEPDLVVLEDDVAVDKTSLVCHLNTLGTFTINPLFVGAGTVLQNDSRMGPGSAMREDCTLLDRSYIVQGEIAESHSMWQGYPAVRTTLEEQHSLYAEDVEKKSI